MTSRRLVALLAAIAAVLLLVALLAPRLFGPEPPREPAAPEGRPSPAATSAPPRAAAAPAPPVETPAARPEPEAAPAPAPGRGRALGRVVDASGAPIAGGLAGYFSSGTSTIAIKPANARSAARAFGSRPFDRS